MKPKKCGQCSWFDDKSQDCPHQGHRRPWDHACAEFDSSDEWAGGNAKPVGKKPDRGSRDGE